jgi:phage terminase large subunit-like protein
MDLSKLPYVQDAFNKVEEYKEGVKDGTIIAGSYIKKLISYADDLEPYYEFRRSAVENIFAFLSLINIEKDEEYAQLILEPFQAYLIYNVFGTYYKGSNRRRYSTSFLFMGRKNGKTSLTAALTIYFLLSGEYANPQSIIVSTVEARKQVLGDLQKIILNSPSISPYLQWSNYWVYINNNKMTSDGGERKLKRLDDVGFCKVVSNDAKKLDSFKLVSAIFDEVHTFPDWSAYLTAKKGTGSRENSLMMLISTAGFLPDGFCSEFVNYCKDILDGKYKDDSIFPMLYTIDDGDEKDMSNREVWKKVNPGYGTILKEHKVDEWYTEAKYNPKARADFLTKTLNVFLDNPEESLLPGSVIDSNTGFVDENKWLGKKCYIGVDLSKTNDLSAVICLFKEEIEEGGKIVEKWEVIPYFFIVNDDTKFDRAKGVNLRPWIANGNLIKCSGKSIDYDLIAKLLIELTEKFDVRGIGYDPLGWNFVADKLDVYNLGLDANVIIPIIQGPKTMAGGLIYLIKLFFDNNINVGANPVMRWTLKNARINTADTNNNPKIFKNKAKDSDEGAVALNNAMTLYYKIELDPDRQAF